MVNFQHSQNEQYDAPSLSWTEASRNVALALVEILPVAFKPDIIV